ncbi:hypothetical protein [Lentzea sp. NPDC003310]|uniref:hypothetical protein n=1 Tax=Lentzea sp. NPDC003310 TaxID=3154447 RepID=UPI0033B16538
MVVFCGCCVVSGVLLAEGDALLLGVVELSGELCVLFGVDVIQVDSGVLLSGSSPAAPWSAMPTRMPSRADPSTAEPPAAHSARTAILLLMLTV